MGKDKMANKDTGAEPASSPPCYAAEADPAYQGYLGRTDLVALLNELLEAERAGAKVAHQMAATADAGSVAAALEALARDEARFCAMLAKHVQRLGGEPSRRTGAFREKVLTLEQLDQRLRLLNRGQGWVVRKLQDALPRISDVSLHDDLRTMLSVHESNIRQCDALLTGDGSGRRE